MTRKVRQTGSTNLAIWVEAQHLAPAGLGSKDDGILR